jgi:GT2 family glycosyltransferase
MIYIVIPVYNRKKFTKDCLLSIRKQSYNNFQTVVIDDGSSDGTGKMLKNKFPEVHVIKGDGNWWWTKSINEGVKYSLENNADYILTLNNDLLMKPNYLQTLMNKYKNNHKRVIGSVVVDINNPQKVHYTGTKWNSFSAKYSSNINVNNYNNLKVKDNLIKTDLLPGRGTIIPVKVFDKIGLYDEKNFPQYMSDEDFSLRARKNSFRLFVSTNSIVYSYINETGENFYNLNSSRFIKSLFSIKSPMRLDIRYNWAKKHGKCTLIYFIFDITRILGSAIRHKFSEIY